MSPKLIKEGHTDLDKVFSQTGQGGDHMIQDSSTTKKLVKISMDTKMRLQALDPMIN